ncbi:SHOCT domain-containing protein [Saccharopolyspora elongata]|uniref:SHOCT domain-containing protein n=1 Tax=Saccharopolyspora elongata TaxID=2530387 RepID=A0A4R4Y904_9PSEU|nr:SHOCT domain-containing protein [Saccharopolyspora elongata]TDD40856.1 SHOCT domain-containing protein [Saccharopolyspora elongata]
MHYWDGYGAGVWGFAMMTVSMVLFWALIIVAIVALVRYLGRTGRAEKGTGSAEEILAERFARGDIDEEEYRRRLQALSEHGRRRT